MLLVKKKVSTINKPMNYENVTTDKKTMTADEVEHKQNKTLKALEKDLQRRNRQQSKRLGKNAKKKAARRAIILEEEVDTSEERVEESASIGVKPPRIPLGRMKRKPNHRERRPEVPEFEEEEAELDSLSVIELPPPPTLKMLTFVDTSVKQLCSKQDVVIAITIDNKEGVPQEDGDLPIEVIADMDGHGNDLVPNIVRELDFAHHFKQVDTPSSMQASILAGCKEKKSESDKVSYIPSKMNYKEYMRKKITNDIMFSSGTTYSAAYIHRNEKTGILKVVVEWVGDSPIFVFVNGELVFEADTHNASNEKEVMLMTQKGFVKSVFTAKAGFNVVSEDEIISKPGKYANLQGGYQLACTRSLGHNGITCVEAERETITAKMTDDVKVIVCSDGVGDMLKMDCDLEKLKTYSAEQIVDLAESRWKQTWKYNGTTTNFPSDGYDDCSAAVWLQKKA